MYYWRLSSKTNWSLAYVFSHSSLLLRVLWLILYHYNLTIIKASDLLCEQHEVMEDACQIAFYFLVFEFISWVVLISHQRVNYPLVTDVNWTYIRRSENVVDVFWRSYAHSIYVLCPGSSNHLSHIFKMMWLLQKCRAYCEEAVYHYELIILWTQHLIKYNFKLKYHIMNNYL